MPSSRRRTPVPPSTAARVQFDSDRTCCVCRTPGKPIQIHHLDGNPRNQDATNLAVLCLGCHDETQKKGGFGRHLQAEQIILYRDNWYEIVASRRVIGETTTRSSTSKWDIELLMSIAETYQENEEWSLLATHYDSVGNSELRDKYIEKALEMDHSDFMVVHLRAMQGRCDAIPDDVIEREAERYAKNSDWSQRARFWDDVGRPLDAVKDYCQSISESLGEGRIFSAAFYLRELAKTKLHRELYYLAYEQAVEEGDLWWQARALQDLGSRQQYDAWLKENADEIESSGQLMLLSDLARAQGDRDTARELRKEIARRTYSAVAGSDAESSKKRTSERADWM